MILAILFMLMVLLCVSALLFFLFYLFLPSLKEQHINTANPLFSASEFAKPVSFAPKDEENFSVKAVVLCSCKKAQPEKKLPYTGLKDCQLFMSLYDDSSVCTHACIGLGSCQMACPQKAIVLENGTAVVTAACNGCGKCISACPKNLIRLLPRNSKEALHCSGAGEESACTERDAVLNVAENEGKGFQFWHKCYKILYGAKER